MQPPPDHSTPPAPVTVVPAEGDAAALAGALAARYPGPAIDLRGTGEPILPDALAREARAHAAARLGRDLPPDRRELLLERAAWCDEHDALADALSDAITELDAEVEDAAARASEAATRLAAVAEQQRAAERVLDQAHKQLLELDVAGQSENEVRRSLETSNLAARQANAAAEEARQRAEQLALTFLDVERRRTAIDAERIPLEAVAGADPEPIAAALARAEHAPLVAPDAATQALADDLERRTAHLAGLHDPGPGVASRELAAAEAALTRARLALDEARRPPTNEPPPWWDHLAELHAAVVDAEVAATATLARPWARKRMEDALAAERALLDELGYDSHLDAVLTGGRPSGRRLDPQAIPDAEAALADAEVGLTTLRAADAAAATYRRARADVVRVRALASALLGIGPEAVTPALLRQPRPDPSATSQLAAALAAAGAEPAGDSLVERAREWLAASADVASRLAELAAERASLLEQYRDLAPEAEAATVDAESQANAAKAARRKVEVLEAELANRVRPVVDPTARAATAVALRDRIGALEARVDGARVEAETANREAEAALELATARAGAARRELDGLARDAAAAIALLPHDRENGHDLMTDLATLAAALREEAGEPGAEDRAAALRLLLDPHQRPSDVVLEPAAGLAATARQPVLDALVAAGTARPVVIVTADHDLLTWADALPAAVGVVVSTEALERGAAFADEPTDPLTDTDHAPAHVPPPTR